MVSKRKFDLYDGREVYIYEISCGNLSLGVLSFGAIINYVKFKGRDIALGFNKIADYLAANAYLGATVGRNANRIKNARFFLDGKECVLTANEGENQLHGGVSGFDKKFYDVQTLENGVVLSRISPDGEEGYPGKLDFGVELQVESDGFSIVYRAKCDKDTIFNPTCHAYFNLDGEGKSALKNGLKLNAEYYTPTDEELIPTGKILPVIGTPFDFLSVKPVDFYFNDKVFAAEMAAKNGYDHNFLVARHNNGVEKVFYIASIFSSDNSLEMKIESDAPAFQLYTSGSLNAKNGKSGEYKEGFGICVEPQFVPNAINSCVAAFKKPILRKGEEGERFIKYTFVEHD